MAQAVESNRRRLRDPGDFGYHASRYADKLDPSSRPNSTYSRNPRSSGQVPGWWFYKCPTLARIRLQPDQ
ncbi:hypothetical protein M408DRAFT_327742 [Serendipita vermifera MAFF 305830]|uniref:Uncharacterized protein n=1 Tax=Serendipita vermifera MAFF 305830 TaxID=933852 RepID=A0A0C3BF42_SERVB|nr:hypothetical protein M408DRAFT_327742 [Serendipita vermifera MAFF 305830]